MNLIVMETLIRNLGESMAYSPVEKRNYLEDKILSGAVGIFKEAPDSYLLAFKEVEDDTSDGQQNADEDSEDNGFPSVWAKSAKVVRKRRQIEELQEEHSSEPPYEEELKASAEAAEKIVSHLLQSTEGVRKQLGVCRKTVPKNFIKPNPDNTTTIVIKGIMNCVEEKLQDELGCKACITLHEDLQDFLSWLLKGYPGMACCPSKASEEKTSFLFKGQEGFPGAECQPTQRKEQENPGVKSTAPTAPVSERPVKKIEQSRKTPFRTLGR